MILSINLHDSTDMQDSSSREEKVT